jgi:Outer membrane protein beta-barrel domain
MTAREVVHVVNIPSNPPGRFEQSISETITRTTELGWAAGAGGEFKINDNWLFRVEYLHYDFGNGPTSLQGGRLSVDVVRAGLSLRFCNGPIAPLLPCNLRYPRSYLAVYSRLLRGSWVFSLDFSMCASREISAPACVSSNRAPPRLPSRGRYVGHRLRLYGWRFTTRDNLPAIAQARTPLIFQRAIVLAIPLH